MRPCQGSGCPGQMEMEAPQAEIDGDAKDAVDASAASDSGEVD